MSDAPTIPQKPPFEETSEFNELNRRQDAEIKAANGDFRKEMAISLDFTMQRERLYKLYGQGKLPSQRYDRGEL